MDHFMGLRNPTLVRRVLDWRPHAVHVTGWAWCSHIWAIRQLTQARIPILFRGDSHLLDNCRPGLQLLLKKILLSQAFAWPRAFLVVGTANRAYYEAFGVEAARLHYCPHSVDVARFAEPAERYEREAASWRTELGFSEEDFIVLFAGKFEPKKRPLELMRVVLGTTVPSLKLVMLGAGPLEADVAALAGSAPERIRLLPFQNQSRMPVAYRLGDVFVLPSAHHETWGLAVNEALASGRPVVVSDRVGCALDVVDAACGEIFASSNLPQLGRILSELAADRQRVVGMRRGATTRAWQFDIAETESRLIDCVRIWAP
jgi:glycosyltransferase involved in cell wall biosynthesis